MEALQQLRSLATTNSLFDALRFLTPVIIEAKLIYHWLCQLQSDWDELLPQTEVDGWERRIKSLIMLKEVSNPRWMGLMPNLAAQNCQLHFFADGS